VSDILLFERLKKRKTFERPDVAPADLRFVLRFDAEFQAYVVVEDQDGQPMAEVNHRLYSGALRQALKGIESQRGRELYRIDWQERPEGAVWLGENEMLIWTLLATERLVNEQGRPIRKLAGLGEAAVVIKPVEGKLECRPAVFHEGTVCDDGRFLSEGCLLIEDRALEVRPLGDNFLELALFQGRIEEQDLERYLSLLFSYFENLGIRYGDFELTAGPPKTAQPTLVFEKVGGDGALYLRVGVSTPRLPPQFFADYQVSRVALVDDMAHRITVHDITQCDIGLAIRDLRERLNRLRRGLDGDSSRDFAQEQDLLIIEKDLAESLIRAELGDLIAVYAIFGAENLRAYNVRAGSPAIKLNLSQGEKWLEGTAELDFGDGARVSLAEALAQYRSGGYIALSDGSRGVVNTAYMEKLDRLFKVQKGRISVSFFDLPLVDALLGDKALGPAAREARETFQGFNFLDEMVLAPPRAEAELRPYQRKGYRWLRYLHDRGLGGCLADDMGLGKTLQALALLSSIYPETSRPSLIVMPATLLFNWRREIEKFTPNLRVCLYYGPQRDIDELDENHLALTTYATVRNDIDRVENTAFCYILLDESQHIKNLASKTTKAVMRLQGRHRLALSGTPVENDLTELYSLFRFLNPTMFGSFAQFKRRYAQPIQKEGDKDAAAELRRKIYPFILRRLKSNVLDELPPKSEQTLYIEMNPAQRRLYENRRAFFQKAIHSQVKSAGMASTRFFVLQALSELRQLASIPEVKSDDAVRSAKREALLAQLSEVVANGHKALVFTNFLGALERIGEDLERAGIPFVAMTGATRDRAALVKRFQSDAGIKTFLMTLKTGGVGLNLTQADYVFLFDPWWNRAAERQAVDRAHRIGQRRAVFTYRMISRDSVEEKIEALQERKLELVDQMIVSDEAWGKSLSDADIEFMLGA